MANSLAATFGRRAWGRFLDANEVSLDTFVVSDGANSVMRQRALDKGIGLTDRIMPENAFLVTSQVREMPRYQLWYGQELVKDQPMRSASLTVIDLANDPVGCLPQPFDRIMFYFSKPELVRMLEIEGGSLSLSLHAQEDCVDQAFQNLAAMFIPALEFDGTADRILFDHLTLAAAWHVMQHYGGKKNIWEQSGEILSPARLKEAKEMLSLVPSSALNTDHIAAHLGLTPVRFVKAFERSTGMSPAKWIKTHRIELSKSYLFHDKHSLREIAEECGFADQSHFTRMFSASTGFTPAAWKHARRS